MRKKRVSSIDGFVPKNKIENRSLGVNKVVTKKTVKKAKPVSNSLTVDGSSLDVVGIDLNDGNASKNRRSRDQRLKKPNKKKSVVRRIVKWFFIIVLLAILGIVGFFAVKFIQTSDNVFNGSILGFTKKERLKADENGRTNILVFGTAEDSEGGQHGGANLTDSIMIISINQDDHNASMISLPRDLWVQYESGCTVGYSGKLNAAYFCASNDGEDEAAGSKALKNKVGEILGLQIQYYVHVNFTAVIEAVDAVGGVEIVIESSDPRGIYDPNFDWKCNYTCNYVRYPNGPTGNMDGVHALALIRARNAQGGYGLPNSNFDREKNQQKVIKALFEKALNTSTLTDINKVLALMNTIGNNLRTDIGTEEIRTFLDVAQNTDIDNIKSISLVDQDEPMVKTGSVSGQSVVMPIAGTFEYSRIHEYVKKYLLQDEVQLEAASVDVYNSSDVAGLATKLAEELEALGMIPGTISNTTASSGNQIDIYQRNNEKSATKAKLEKLYGVTVKPFGSIPSELSGSMNDFVVIIHSETALIGENEE